MTALYVDVSHYDRDRRSAPLDWAAISAAGLPGVMLARSSYGDPQGFHPETRYFREHLAGAAAAGYQARGGYHNLIHGDAACIGRQVDYLRSEMDAADATWAMLDVEPYEALKANDLWPRWSDVQAFHDRWAQVESRVLCNYIGQWVWSGWLGKPDLTQLRGPLTNANYPMAAPTHPDAMYAQAGGDAGPGWVSYGGRVPDVWQFTSRAPLSGASAATDVNAYRGSLDDLIAMLGGDVASAAYKAWLAAGKPLTPCQPIRDYVARLKVTFPRGAQANLFGWYANDAHYQASLPEDHTPFSATGWPSPSPRWVVFATDVMHRPELGVDCNVLFPYWLAEAKAGRTPWVKYLIWQAKLYDVRNGWRPVANSGHFDHIHISIRTDHQNTSLGAWSLVPGKPPTQGDDDMAQQVFLYAGKYWMGDGNERKVVSSLVGKTTPETNVVTSAWKVYPGADGLGLPAPDLTVRGWTDALVDLAFGTVATNQPVEISVDLDDEDIAALAAKVVGAVPSAEDIADAVVDEESARLKE